MPGSTWMVNATAFGHGDVLDDLYYEGLVATQFCSTDQSQDRVTYRTFIAGEIWSFVSIVVHQDCQYQQFIQDPSVMIVETWNQLANDMAMWANGSLCLECCPY